MSELQKFTLPLTFSSVLHLCLIAVLGFSFTTTQLDKQKKPERLPEIIQASAILDETKIQEQAERLTQQENNKKVQQQKKQQQWQAEQKKQQQRLDELKEQRKIEEQQAAERTKKRKEEQAAEKKREAEIEKKKQLEITKQAKLKKKKAAEEKKKKAEQAKKKAKAAKKEAERKAAEKRKKEQQRLAAAKRKKQAEIKRKADAKRKAEQARIASENASRLEQSTVNAKDIVRRKVNQKWIRPISLKGKFQCVIKVKLFPGGGVMDARVIKSSGNAVFDRSAVNAVWKAEPLPVPKDPALFAKFKSFSFIFKPE